jgi:cytochrome bd-type quinol oxidase subunit 2
MRNAVRSLRWVAIAITVAISLAYLVVPVYNGSAGRQTVIEVNGWWVVVLLLLPVATVLLPYALSEGRRHAAEGGAAALLTFFALITGFTIGTPYLLPAVLLWVAWALQRRGAHSREESPSPTDEERGTPG